MPVRMLPIPPLSKMEAECDKLLARVERVQREIAIRKGEGAACLSCGAHGDGGYEVEDGPGPFCSACWQKLEDHFLEGLTQAVLRAVAELPDRTSPEDSPGLLAVHENELKEILEGAIDERRS